MADHITHDPIYNTVDRDDFPAMIESIATATAPVPSTRSSPRPHDHFWDPTDPAYLDFTQPFDLSRQTLMPRSMTIELNCAVADQLDEGQQIRLANQNTRFMLSSILHGEQGALSLSASLCMILRDPGAQEYAANQTREEARHVTAFAKYIERAGARRCRSGTTLKNLMTELVLAPEVYKKLVGMQMLIEGLAMGAFATHPLAHRRSAAAPPGAAGDDRRGVPPQVRQDLGRPHRPEAHRGRA